MTPVLRHSALWQLRTRELPLGARTLVMGVVNITPDSFSDGGLYRNTGAAVEHGLRLLEEGADLLDLGAESTRPGSRAGDPENAAVSAEQEQERLLPVVDGILKAKPDAVISVDTYKAPTARAAVMAGAEIVNDVSGLMWDAGMAEVCAELGCGVVLMHTRGRPEEWRTQAPLESGEVLGTARDGLLARVGIAQKAGISPRSVVLDAGYGFGKRLDENYALIRRQDELLALGFPLLAGVSRKSFLTRTLLNNDAVSRADGEVSMEDREMASVAALVAAILQGASLVRVHCVRPAVVAAAIADAVLAGG